MFLLLPSRFHRLVQWLKGARDITNASRTIKEVFNDYVRFSIKESRENDSGCYFVTARNKHGVDRAFCQVTVRELSHEIIVFFSFFSMQNLP